MELRPQDVLVALKLAVLPGDVRPTYAGLAADLGMSASEVHAAVKRAKAARLVFDWDGKLRGNKLALLEFAIHGIKYAFPAQRGGIALGIPTAYAAPPLAGEIIPDKAPPPVWPSAKGSVRGVTLQPIAKYAPEASQRDPKLYKLLTLIDAMRMGTARERELAAKHLSDSLKIARPS
jgi:hypothetical protein